MKRPEFAVVFARLFRAMIMANARLLRYRARFRMLSHLIESLNPVLTTKTKYGEIKFYCPAKWPFSRSAMKGAAIMGWIDGFSDDDVLWDIGANVGAFTLYAARRGLRVVAIEPAAVNYFVLARNIEINGMDDRVTSLDVALHEETELGYLYMVRTEIGSAHHLFAGPQTDGTAREPAVEHNRYRQSVLGYSLDEFIERFRLDFPTHIKIDVDGNEALILKGAQRTLADSRLTSVMVEVRDNTLDEVERLATRAGMICVERKGQERNDGDTLFVRG